MRKLVEVKEAAVSKEQIQFIIEGQEPAEAIEAAGRMITDSDGEAFVYLIDSGTEYIYVQFKEHFWQDLAAAMQRKDVPLLIWGEQVMPMDAFHEEMWMLIENIEGNDNYGEAFRIIVEQAFREALASRA